MGGVCSCGSDTIIAGTPSTEGDLIDRQLAEDRARDSLHFKILILGAGESGKSTIVKQLTFIHKQQLTREEKLSYVKVLQNNTVQCMVTLVKESETFGYLFTTVEERTAADNIVAHDQRLPMPESMVAEIELLWSSTSIQSTYARRNEFWHLEATEYYFNHCARFVEPDYFPTEEDIVMARKRTTGVVVSELITPASTDGPSVKWSVYDVGGQRSERRKWLNCFDNVKAIIYVSNLAGYNSVLFEDKAVNRMHESLNLFEATMNNPAFANTPVFLFLNKKDLFESLLRQSNIDCCFPEYTGPNQLRPCIEYISEQFQRRMPNKHSRALVLLLAARVKKDVQYCFEEVKEVLLEYHSKGIKKAIEELERVEKRNKTADLYRMKPATSPNNNNNNNNNSDGADSAAAVIDNNNNNNTEFHGNGHNNNNNDDEPSDLPGSLNDSNDPPPKIIIKDASRANALLTDNNPNTDNNINNNNNTANNITDSLTNGNGNNGSTATPTPTAADENSIPTTVTAISHTNTQS